MIGAHERRRPRKPPSGLPKLTEAQIQRQCVDFMALDGWRPLKTDPCSDKARGKGFGEIGMADHLFIRYEISPENARRAGWAQVLWVEFKRPGGIVSEHQMLWHVAERKAGAFTACAILDFEPTFDGFIAWYRKSGLLRRVGL